MHVSNETVGGSHQVFLRGGMLLLCFGQICLVLLLIGFFGSDFRRDITTRRQLYSVSHDGGEGHGEDGLERARNSILEQEEEVVGRAKYATRNGGRGVRSGERTWRCNRVNRVKLSCVRGTRSRRTERRISGEIIRRCDAPWPVPHRQFGSSKVRQS
jgi:hypothetical protein